MDRSSGQPVISVMPVTSRSTPGDDCFAFRLEVQELPGEDNFGNPVSAPVLRYLQDYAPKPKPIGKNECQALAILERLLATSSDNPPSVAVIEWRTAFKRWFIEESQTDDHTAANKAANTTWSRAENGLREKGIIRYEGITGTRVVMLE